MNKKISLGFTLVEMAVALIIAGAILSAGLKLLAVQSERAAISTSQKHQETIKQALITYLGKLGRLPCPDQDNDGKDDRDAGSNCLSNIGQVPYLTLGLDREIALDGWDNYIAYIISPIWRMSYNQLAPAGDLYETSVIGNAFWPGVSTGQIIVKNRFPLTGPQTIANAAIGLISYGRNGAGAMNIANNRNESPPATTDEFTNTAPVMTIFKRDFVDDASVPGGAFDDIVMSIAPDDLTGPLITSGAIQPANPATALSQANDFVIAQIINSKAICPNPLVPGCPTGNYFYTIPGTLNITAPNNAVAWGASYSGLLDYIYPTSPITGNAYQLTVNGYPPKPISRLELFTIVGRMSGY